MPKNVNPGNAVVASVMEAAALYHVARYRMQSRVVSMPGAGGKARPVFIGEWVDELGELQRAGMADVLLTPRIDVLTALKLREKPFPMNARADLQAEWIIAVPLWVECKYGTGKLRAPQIAFRKHVEASGAFYLEAHDSADAVIKWFEEKGVRRW